MRFVFVGNRRFVLEEMIALKLDIVNVFVAANTHLEKDVKNMNLNYEVVHNKKELVDLLEKEDFDVLVSNGCPFILPVEKMKKAKYVNIHPSYLPDLKGYDPVIGAVLHQRSSGATCHIMDSGIDTGDIIAQEEIQISDDLDVPLLYQLSFIAEKRVFNQAHRFNYESQYKQTVKENAISYRRSKEDMTIYFDEPKDLLFSKVKSFNNLSCGLSFYHCDEEYKCFGIEEVNNSYLNVISETAQNLELILIYEDNLIFKKEDQLIKLKRLSGDLSLLKKGDFFNVRNHD